MDWEAPLLALAGSQAPQNQSVLCQQQHALMTRACMQSDGFDIMRQAAHACMECKS